MIHYFKTRKLIKERKKKLGYEKKRLEVPLTGIENKMEENTVLITRTDLNGRITYANQNFLEITEMAEEEVLGKPHSIIRNPEVPRSVYFDMWQTIQKGLPWHGVTKNRASSGNHYWVDANVAPRKENGRIVGYISVRRKPTTEQIQKWDKLFKNILEGKEELPPSDRPMINLKFRMIFLFIAGWMGLILGLFLNFYNFYLSLSTSFFSGIYLLILSINNYKYIVSTIEELSILGNMIAEGNLTVQIPHDRNDELGKIYKSNLNMLINMAGIIGELKESLFIFQNSINILNEKTKSIYENSIDITKNSQDITSSAKNVNDIIQNVSASVEEFSISLNEVSRFATEANNFSQQTIHALRKVTRSADELVEFVKKTNSIVDSIQSIASQTNLLALNAMIEAASSGEAGRGFAVVANEIKELSRQVSGAVVMVREQIEGIQSKTTEIVNPINEVNYLASQLEALNHNVSAAITEQSTVIKDISKSVHQVSTLSDNVSGKIVSIEKEISQTTDDLKYIEEIVVKIKMASENLYKIVENIKV